MTSVDKETKRFLGNGKKSGFKLSGLPTEPSQSTKEEKAIPAPPFGGILVTKRPPFVPKPLTEERPEDRFARLEKELNADYEERLKRALEAFKVKLRRLRKMYERRLKEALEEERAKVWAEVEDKFAKEFSRYETKLISKKIRRRDWMRGYMRDYREGKKRTKS